ncbi:hypothetical protein ACN9U3_08795 [Staphylococcus caprae]|uniref:hypothetical protein n=1 Tax=Staphylococcus caprae TaxID=29380 RepID=UPI003B2157F8
MIKTNKHLPDLDVIELSSGWNYNDRIASSDEINVNNTKYKVIKQQKPTNTGLGYKIYEQYDNDNATGNIVISYDGTNFSDINDVKTDLHLAGVSIPSQMKEARKTYFDLKQKYADANSMDSDTFYKKYKQPPKNYKGKSIVKVGGNSLGGAVVQYIGILDPNVGVVTTNTAPLPMSIAKNTRKNADNIHNYHSKSDILTMINKGGLMYNTIVGKHIYIDNGTTTFGALTPSHTGYNFKDKKKLDKFDQDNIINEEIFTSRNGLKIYADMDENTPIFIWSGDAVGAGVSKIKLDKGHLAELSSYVDTRLTNYINQIDSKMKDIRKSTVDEHNKFEQHVEETKAHFKEITKFKELEGLIHSSSELIKNSVNSKADYLKDSLTKLKNEDNIFDLIGADTIINGIIDFIDDIKSKVAKFITYGENIIEAILNIVNNTIVKMFLNPVNGFMDGAREEILAHLNIVIPNIQLVKKQVTNFGEGINDILKHMSRLDDNVMVNNVEINKNATKQESVSLEESKYLAVHLTIVEKIVEYGIKTLSSELTIIVTPIVTTIVSQISIIRGFSSILSANIGKLEWIASKVPFAKVVADELSDFHKKIDKLIDFLDDINLILSKSLTIESITSKLKDFFTNAVLSNTLLGEIKILSSSAEGNAEMLITELQAVLSSLSQNEGKSVESLRNSTKSLTNNLSKLKEQLNKTAN